MMHIEGEHGSALDGDDHLAVMKLRDTHLLRETLYGACDDDCETTAPYIGLCPDESDHEDGSPLDFMGITPAQDRAYTEALDLFMKQGFDFSANVAIVAYAFDHNRDPHTGKPLERPWS